MAPMATRQTPAYWARKLWVMVRRVMVRRVVRARKGEGGEVGWEEGEGEGGTVCSWVWGVV